MSDYDLDCDAYDENHTSSYISSNRWHRDDRLKVILAARDIGENAWMLHAALMELGSDIGYVAITNEHLADVLDVHPDAIRRALKKLTSAGIWIQYYDKKRKTLYLQVNPSFSQKFNDCAKERAAIASWETLSEKAVGKIKSIDFSLEEAEQYVRLQAALVETRPYRGEFPMQPSVLYDYLTKHEGRRDAAVNNLQKQLEELTKVTQTLVEKFVPAEEKAEVQRRLRLVKKVEDK